MHNTNNPILLATIETDRERFVTAYGNAEKAEFLRPLARKVGLSVVNTARANQFAYYRASFGRDAVKAIVDRVDVRALAAFATLPGIDAETALDDAEYTIRGQVTNGRGKADTERKVKAALVSCLLHTIAHLCEDPRVNTEFGDYCAMIALSHCIR